jgi:hypothetical protein
MARLECKKYSVKVLLCSGDSFIDAENLRASQALAQKDHLLFLKRIKFNKDIRAVEIIEGGFKSGRVYGQRGKIVSACA